MQVYPVGCIENGTPVYVHVAATDKIEAENFVSTTRPYIQVISALDSCGQAEAGNTRTVKVSKDPY